MKSCQPGCCRHRDDGLPATAESFPVHEFADVEGEVRVSVSIKPLEDRIVVRPLEAEQTTASGLVIPDSAQEKPQEGEVIAVSSGTLNDKGELHPLDVKTGDRFQFGKWSGTEAKLDGEELLIMKESDIMGVLGNSAAAKQAA